MKALLLAALLNGSALSASCALKSGFVLGGLGGPLPSGMTLVCPGSIDPDADFVETYALAKLPIENVMGMLGAIDKAFRRQGYVTNPAATLAYRRATREHAATVLMRPGKFGGVIVRPEGNGRFSYILLLPDRP